MKKGNHFINRSSRVDYNQKSTHGGFDLAHIHKQEGFQDL